MYVFEDQGFRNPRRVWHRPCEVNKESAVAEAWAPLQSVNGSDPGGGGGLTFLFLPHLRMKTSHLPQDNADGVMHRIGRAMIWLLAVPLPALLITYVLLARG